MAPWVRPEAASIVQPGARLQPGGAVPQRREDQARVDRGAAPGGMAISEDLFRPLTEAERRVVAPRMTDNLHDAPPPEAELLHGRSRGERGGAAVDDLVGRRGRERGRDGAGRRGAARAPGERPAAGAAVAHAGAGGRADHRDARRRGRGLPDDAPAGGPRAAGRAGRGEAALGQDGGDPGRRDRGGRRGRGAARERGGGDQRAARERAQGADRGGRRGGDRRRGDQRERGPAAEDGARAGAAAVIGGAGGERRAGRGRRRSRRAGPRPRGPAPRRRPAPRRPRSGSTDEDPRLGRDRRDARDREHRRPGGRHRGRGRSPLPASGPTDFQPRRLQRRARAFLALEPPRAEPQRRRSTSRARTSS